MNEEANKEPTPGSVTPSANVEATGIPVVPTVETVVENKETATVGGVPTVVSPDVPAPVTPPTPTDYKWDAATNTYKEVATTQTPETTTATPATPAPVTTSAAASPTTGEQPKSQEYYDQFKGRENEVLANLNSAYSSGIKDSEGIKKFASYDTASPEKKAAIDAFIANKQKEELSAKEGSQFGTEEGIFGALNNNVMVPDSVKSTPSYKSAYDRYRKLKFLSGYDANSIAAILKNGKLVPGSRTYQDLYNTEAGKAKIEKANKILSISGGGVDVGNAGKVLTSEVIKENANLQEALEDGSLSVDEFKALTSSPELEAEAKDLAAKQAEIKKLQSARNKIRDDVDKEYGAGLTSSEKAQLVANRTRDINRTIEPLVLEYDSAFGVYSDKKKELVSLLSTNLDFYKADKEEQAKQAAIQSQRDYETEKEKRKNVYDSVNAQIKFALENGVDLQRTDANVVIADAEAYSKANNVSLEEAIKKTFTEPLTSKPSWKTAAENAANKSGGTKFTMGFDPVTGTPYVLDTKTGEISSGTVTSGVGGGAVSTSGMRTDRHNNPTAFTTDIASQAGLVEGVDYVKGDSFGGGKYFTAKIIGDPLEVTRRVIDKIGFSTSSGAPRWTYTDKLGLNNATWSKMSDEQKNEAIKKMYSQEGGDGSLFSSFSPSKKATFDSFEEMSKGGDVSYKDKLSLALSAGYSNVSDFSNDYDKYKSSKKQESRGLNELGYNPSIVDVYARINAGKTIPKDEMAALGGDYEQIKKEAVAYGNAKKKEGVQQVDFLIESLRKLKEFGKATRVASQIPGAGIASSKAAEFKAIYDQVIAQSSLDNLLALKSAGATFGALSDNEMRYIKSASQAGQLAWDLDNDTWNKKIDKLIESSQKIKSDIGAEGNVGGTSVSERLRKLREGKNK